MNSVNGPTYGPRRPSNNLLAALEHTRRPNSAYQYGTTQPPPSRPSSPPSANPRPSRPSLSGHGAHVTIGEVHGGKTKKHRRNRKTTRKNRRNRRKTRNRR